MKTIEGTKDNWSDTVGRRGTVLVLWIADYAAAAKRYLALLDRVADQLQVSERMMVVTVNVDAEQELAIDHGLRGVPTLCVYRDAGLCETFLGGRGLRETEALLRRLYPEEAS
jgi:thioredoxin-like negative regulator of GroEL